MAAFFQVALFLTVLTSASAQDYHIERVLPANSGARLTTEILPPAQYSLPLTSKVARPAYKQAYSNAIRRGRKVKTAGLAGAGGDSEYLTDIEVGGQNFKVIVDTGSYVSFICAMIFSAHRHRRSDTWLAAKGFKCYNLTRYAKSSQSRFQIFPLKISNLTCILIATQNLRRSAVSVLPLTSRNQRPSPPSRTRISTSATEMANSSQAPLVQRLSPLVGLQQRNKRWVSSISRLGTVTESIQVSWDWLIRL